MNESKHVERTHRDTLLHALGTGSRAGNSAVATEISCEITQQVLPTNIVICASASIHEEFGSSGFNGPAPKWRVGSEIRDFREMRTVRNAVAAIRRRVAIHKQVSPRTQPLPPWSRGGQMGSVEHQRMWSSTLTFKSQRYSAQIEAVEKLSSSRARSRIETAEKTGVPERAVSSTRRRALASAAASALVYGMIITPAAQANAGTAFTTPSGDIACTMTTIGDGKGAATCEVVANMAGPALDCPWRQSGMDRNHYTLDEGGAPIIVCGSTLFAPQLPTLAFGHSRTVGAITCYSRSQELTCADDSGSRHSFTVSTYTYRMA